MVYFYVVHDPRSKKYFIHNVLDLQKPDYALSDEEQDSDESLEENQIEDKKNGVMIAILTYILMVKQENIRGRGINEEVMQMFVVGFKCYLMAIC